MQKPTTNATHMSLGDIGERRALVLLQHPSRTKDHQSSNEDISMEAMHKHQVSTIKTAARNATQYFDGIRWTPGNKGVYVH